MKTFHNLIGVLVELCEDNAITSEDVLEITGALGEDGFFTEEDAEHVNETVAKEAEEP